MKKDVVIVAGVVIGLTVVSIVTGQFPQSLYRIAIIAMIVAALTLIYIVILYRFVKKRCYYAH